MHFALPENLKVQVLAYDATLKKLAKENAALTTGKRDRSKRFGVPDDLFPAYIATPEQQKAAATAINNVDGTHGWRLVAPDKKALIAYYNNVWTAVAFAALIITYTRPCTVSVRPNRPRP